MARRYLGSVISGSGLDPSSTVKSGMWGLDELGPIQASSKWYATQPVLSAATFSVANSSGYSFAAQAIGDADPKKVVFVGVMNISVSTVTYSTVTIAGSAATLVSTGNAIQLWAANIESATTTATIELSATAAQSRVAVHVFHAKGVNDFANPVYTTAGTGAATSSGESLSVDIPPGAFALTFHFHALVNSTLGWTAGATAAAGTSLAGESGRFASAITNWTTALRSGHVISTTHTTNGTLQYHTAVLK